jgi:hypothetical protein
MSARGPVGAIDPYVYAVTESSATLENLQVGVGIWGDFAEDSVVPVCCTARADYSGKGRFAVAPGRQSRWS